MVFAVVQPPSGLYVEGNSEAPAVGHFSGPVLAIAVRGDDPVSAAASDRQTTAADDREGLLGWGTTSFLVADPSKPAPVWVTKNDIDCHRIEGAPQKGGIGP